MNDYFEMILKGAVAASDICQHLPGGSEENHEESQRLSGIRRKCLPNTDTQCWRYSNPFGSFTSGQSVHH